MISKKKILKSLTLLGAVCLYGMYNGNPKEVFADEKADQPVKTVINDFSDQNEWSLNSNPQETQLTPRTDITQDQNGSLELSGTGAGEIDLTKNINYKLSDFTGFDFTVFSENSEGIKDLTIEFALDNGTNLTKTFIPNEVPNGWTTQSLSLKNLENYEGNADAAITSIKFKVTHAEDKDGKAAPAYGCAFDSVRLIKSNSGTVMFTADDGTESQYVYYYPILKARGLKATLAINGSNIDGNIFNKPGLGLWHYLTTDQVKEMYNNGFDMINHGYRHLIPLSYMSKECQRQELNKGRDYLNSIGCTRTSNFVAYQGGLYNDTTLEVMKEEGYVWGRTTHYGLETDLSLGNHEVHVKDLTFETTAEQAKSYVDDAIDTGNAAVFMNHYITENDADGTDDPMFGYLFWKKERLEALCDYVKEQRDAGRIKVVTASDLANDVQ